MNKKTIAAGKLFAKRGLILITLFVMAGNVMLAQQRKISGVVTNPADNTAIPTVSVMVKGTSRGTTTDAFGRFTIEAAPTDTLVFSAVGFQTRQLAAGKEETLTVQLAAATDQLESVVVTALGIRREEKALGYAVSNVKGEELTEAMSNNWTNALTGKVAGLNLLKSGGGPSGTNKIILRGENSLNGNSEALIVVDGVIISGSSGQMTGTGSSSYLQSESPVDFGTSLNDINPEDIESVTVLKGPGASALYGARGANGAIIITTKSGKAIQKGLGVTFNSNATFETINRWPDYQYEYGQGATMQHTWYSYNDSEDGQSTRSTSSAWGPRFAGQSYYQYDPVTRTKGETRTPWVPYTNNRKDFFQTAKTFTNSITVEGGNRMTSARLSLTNLTNDWIVPNTGYKRNTVALSVNQRITDKLQISSKINYTNKVSDNLPTTGYNNQTIMYFIRGLVPNANIDWFKDYWVPGQEHIAQTRPFSSLLDNPYLQAYEMLNKSNRHGVIGNISATYQFTKDFSLMVRTALDYASEAREQQRPMGTQKFVNGMFRSQNIFTMELNSDFLLRYSRDFGKFKAGISGGGNSMINRYIRDDLRADQLIYPGIYNLANSKNLIQANPYRAEYRVNSFYALAQFSYDEWLFLDMTARYDWSSTLATPTSKDQTGFFYPSVNASAILSEKLKLPAAISFLKLRGSWAQVGSGGTSPYRTSYAYDPTEFPGGLSNPTAIANPNLRALLTTSIEAGLDIRFFNNRIGLDVAVYKNDTKDEIFRVPIDRASGYSASIENAGLVQNKGIEVQVNGNVIKGGKKGIGWNIFGTFYSNRNKVVELVDSIDTYVMSTGPANRGSLEARPGGRMGDLYGIGYNRAPDGQIIYNSQGYPTRTETVVYLGNVNADWKASLGSEWTYRNFRLSVLFDCQVGGVAYSLTHAVLAEEGKLKKTLPGRYNGIVGEGVQFDGDKYVPNTIMATNIQQYYDAHFNRDNVEANTFSTDYVKFREARIDYNIPASTLKKIGLQRATVGIYGRDLIVWSHWPSFDPEFGTLNNGNINAGFEIGQFPSTRSMGVALTVAF